MKEGGRKEVESSIRNKDEHHRVRKKYILILANNLFIVKSRFNYNRLN